VNSVAKGSGSDLKAGSQVSIQAKSGQSGDLIATRLSRCRLDRRASARGFYGIIAVSVLAGLGFQYSPISPMKALFWSTVINGVVAVPLMAVIILLVSKKSVMGAFTASRSIIILGSLATAVMGAATVRMLIPS
jgi:Mn2+/Fe2+ NRAMP family transporter